MDLYLLVIFFLISILMAANGLVKHGKRIYEPLLPIATVFMGFIGLQLVGLANQPRALPSGGLNKTIIMAILCVSAFWWGYSRKIKPLKFLSGNYSPNRLFAICLILSVFGSCFFFMISRLPDEMTSARQWTGLPVAYLFFAQTLTYGFALACLLYTRFGDRRALWVAGVGVFFFLDRIIIAGRRSSTAEFFFIIVLALFFGRGHTIRHLPHTLPRWVMLGIMVIMVFLMHSTGEYRALAKNQGWSAPVQATSRIDFFDNLEFVGKNGGFELRNAVYMIEAYDRTLNFDFGLTHWNQLILDYIPAQLVGRDIKEAFMLPLPDVANQVFGYRPVIGTTVTGLVDAFGSFWYLGWIKFFIIGMIVRKIWNAAQLGGLASQLLYMLIIVKTMHVVTHTTHWFFAPWVHMAIFLFPCLWWARKKTNHVVMSCSARLAMSEK